MGHQPTTSVLEENVRIAIGAIEVDHDHQYPAGYRRLLLQTVLERALATAAARAETYRVH
jgi:hypothetical protein